MKQHDMKIWLMCDTNFPDNAKSSDSIIRNFQYYFSMLDAIISKSHRRFGGWFTPVIEIVT